MKNIIFGCGNIEKKSDINLLNYAFSKGIKYFDTSPSYGKMKSELILGDFLKGKREGLIILTKTPIVAKDTRSIIISLLFSLKNLGLNYIDIFLLHYPYKNISDYNVSQLLLSFKNKGLIKKIGLSNVSLLRLRYFHKILKDDLYCVQINYGFSERIAEELGIINYCIEHNIKVQCWGIFGDQRIKKYFLNKGVFDEYSFSYYQYSLQWLSNKGALFYPIIGVSSFMQLDNLFMSSPMGLEVKYIEEYFINEKFMNFKNNKFI